MAACGFFSLVCIAGIGPDRSITQDDFWGAQLPTSSLGELLKPANLRLFRESELVNEVIYCVRELLLFSWGSQKEPASLFAAFRTNLSSLPRFCWHAGKLLFQSFPNSGCGGNKPHAFHLNEIVVSNLNKLLSTIPPSQSLGTWHTAFPSVCHGVPAKESQSPNLMWAWFFSSVTLETGDNWLLVAERAAAQPNLHESPGTWHVLVWKLDSLVITNLRRHPALCQRWRLRRKKCPWCT